MRKHPSFADFDRPYRRGFVLGISLAELFIILVFLLLMTMMGYATSENDERVEYADSLQTTDELKDKLAVAEERVQQLESAIVDNNTDINDLIVQIKQIKAEANELKDKLAVAEGRAQQAESRLESAIMDNNDLIVAKDKEIKQITAERDRLQDRLTTAESFAEIGKQIQQIAQEKGMSPDELIAKIKKGEMDRLGQDSPCWYSMAKRLNGEDYERPLYVFDIRISDDSIFVKDVPVSAPEHKKQKEALKFNRTALNRELNYKEFEPAFLPFKAAGENKKIRYDRRCTFYVRVWDATSDTNKLGYKQAHNVIVQGVFITYEVKEDSWPH